MRNIYEECPIYKNNIITLRQTMMDDAEELLECYSDEKGVMFLNSDNCDGDDFHYTTIETMKQAIEFWEFSYKNKYFVRWTIIFNDTREKIGTIEMFHRVEEDEFNHYGVLRIDLKTNYETKLVIENILETVNENFYEVFNVEAILTKAIPDATNRIHSLLKKGYRPINRKFMIYNDYFVNREKQKEVI
ncbi:GNAT family N-acetyltransferase [Clostridium akagii]|uniref:GNAT family N-acetyltransferase n=1 Tax=Clostridium akagii TaxID=91623 RepID=UPI00047D8361|nr:GNAT family N-acetyltransferase [Clostridium akagii]